jgi:hypothetical protein
VPAALGCPKTYSLRCPQLADSISLRFVNIAAHNQMFMGKHRRRGKASLRFLVPQVHEQFDRPWPMPRIVIVREGE